MLTSRCLTLAILLAAHAGCAPSALPGRAIRARGGPLAGLVREVEADVHLAFPGRWRWRAVFLVPDRYAWTIYTSGEADHYLLDGRTTRAFVGEGPVATVSGQDSALRTHARFTAVMNLDALRVPGVRITPLAASDLPAGARAGIEAVFIDDATRYRLAFDARDLLVELTGPLAMPPLGAGTVTARFTDFRPTGRFVLPWRTVYTFGDQPLAEERVLAACPDPPGLAPADFATPARLPSCEPPSSTP